MVKHGTWIAFMAAGNSAADHFNHLVAGWAARLKHIGICGFLINVGPVPAASWNAGPLRQSTSKVLLFYRRRNSEAEA
jgi:hypothetical protein